MWKRVGTWWRWMLAKCPDWLALSRVGKSRVFRSSYFWFLAVPLAAHLLAEIGDKIEIPLGDSAIVIALGLPFTWKCFYFSALFFVVGSFTYSAFCPGMIRDFKDFADFEAKGGSHLELLRVVYSLTVEIRPQEIGALREFHERYVEKEEDPVTFRPTWSSVSAWCLRRRLANPFTWARQRAATVGTKWRVCCAVNYLLGGLLILWVLFEQARWVWRYV